MLVRQTLKKNTVDPTQIGSIDGKRQLTFVIPLYIDIPNERLAKDNGCTNVIFFYSNYNENKKKGRLSPSPINYIKITDYGLSILLLFQIYKSAYGLSILLLYQIYRSASQYYYYSRFTDRPLNISVPIYGQDNIDIL